MMFLDKDELRELTGKMRRLNQIAELNNLGIEHKVRSDGAVIVLKSHVEKVFDGEVKRAPKSKEPNWNHIHA